jgi:hypothetical protein
VHERRMGELSQRFGQIEDDVRYVANVTKAQAVAKKN